MARRRPPPPPARRRRSGANLEPLGTRTANVATNGTNAALKTASTSTPVLEANTVSVPPSMVPIAPRETSPRPLPVSIPHSILAISLQDFVKDPIHRVNLPPVLYRAYNDGSMGINENSKERSKRYSKEEAKDDAKEEVKERSFQSEWMRQTEMTAPLEKFDHHTFRTSFIEHTENNPSVMDGQFENFMRKLTAELRLDRKTKKMQQQQKHRKPTPDSKEPMSSIWISFSSSLLTTLQRAQWMVARGFSNVTIAAVDTASLQKPQYAQEFPFICPVPALCNYFNYVESRKYVKFNCHEEYLVLDQIHCEISHIPFQLLYNGGIGKLLPELERGEVKDHIGSGLEVLRRATFGSRLEFPLTKEIVEDCRDITRLFFKGQRCNLIFFALLAIRKRPMADPAVDGLVKDMMRMWRRKAAFDEQDNVRIDNLFYFKFQFDFTQPNQSSHTEIVQFAKIGQRLTMHNRDYEKIIGAEIMKKIWGKFLSCCQPLLLIASSRI